MKISCRSSLCREGNRCCFECIEETGGCSIPCKEYDSHEFATECEYVIVENSIQNKYDDIDLLIEDYKNGNIDLYTYIQEYNRLCTDEHTKFSESCEREGDFGADS